MIELPENGISQMGKPKRTTKSPPKVTNPSRKLDLPAADKGKKKAEPIVVVPSLLSPPADQTIVPQYDPDEEDPELEDKGDAAVGGGGAPGDSSSGESEIDDDVNKQKHQKVGWGQEGWGINGWNE